MWNSLPNGSLSFLWVEGDGSINPATQMDEIIVSWKGADVHGVLLWRPLCVCEWQSMADVKPLVTHASKDNRCVKVRER